MGRARHEHIIQESVIAQPGQYIVLGRAADPNINGGYQADYMYTDFFLANDGDSVVVVDPNGKITSKVSYKSVSPWPAKTQGVSIERISLGEEATLATNWTLATQTYGKGDKGTPGQPNGAPKPAFGIDDSVGDWQHPTIKAALRFSPHDKLEDHVVSSLLATKSHLRMAFFNLRLPGMVQILTSLVDDGVDVDVLLDKKQQDLEYNIMGEELLAAGISVTLVEKTKAAQATMHTKFTVIDHHLVLTGSANYSSTALNKSDEDLITLSDPDIAERFLKEFVELKVDEYETSKSYEGDPQLTVWMGPEDKPSNRIIDQINKATDVVLVAMFQLNLGVLTQALLDAKDRGCVVLVVLDEVQAVEEDEDEVLEAEGVSIFRVKNTISKYAEMHSKFVVIDHKTVVMGSYNWTALASFYNDETIIIIHDDILAARVEGKFADLLTSYNLPDPNTLGLSTGSRMVTFNVTNVNLDQNATLTIESVGSGPFATPVALEGSSVTTSLTTGERVEYRYAVTGPDGKSPENGEVHSFTVPFAPGPFQVFDIFRQ
jgi:phosphatidylserine/phosphatidylglycerophosphate/cardiolipin synthase-like enzyme